RDPALVASRIRIAHLHGGHDRRHHRRQRLSQLLLCLRMCLPLLAELPVLLEIVNSISNLLRQPLEDLDRSRFEGIGPRRIDSQCAAPTGTLLNRNRDRRPDTNPAGTLPPWKIVRRNLSIADNLNHICTDTHACRTLTLWNPLRPAE